MPPTVFHSVDLQTWPIRKEISITFCLNVSEPYVTKQEVLWELILLQHSHLGIACDYFKTTGDKSFRFTMRFG